MSKIGKQPIKIPQGVTVTVNGEIKARGPKGELQMAKPEGFAFNLEENALEVKPSVQILALKNGPALWGLYRSLASNLVKGVQEGFEKTLEFEGVGFKAALKGADLELQMGFSHPVAVKAPEGITFKVEKNKIIVLGTDKSLVGEMAAKIRSVKPPEPYKGKGIRYEKEIIIKKAGKKAITAS